MPLAHERAELIASLFALQQAFEALIVRGLESTSLDDTRQLAALGDELARAGARYLAELVAGLVHAIREHHDDAARALLRAQTAMRVLERVLSLDAAAEAFGHAADGADAREGDVDVPTSGPAAAASTPAAAASTPAPAASVLAAAASTPAPAASRPAAAASTPAPAGSAPAASAALVPVLDELAGLVEGLVAAGLTAATAATQEKLDASFREVSRMKLLRLAAVLRYVGDECGRFLAESPQFSPRRLAFFLHRTWLLCRGLARAITQRDPAALARLTLQSAPQPVAALTVAVVGVQKRALLDGSAAFDFRMQTLADAAGVPRGARLVWSCVFGARKQASERPRTRAAASAAEAANPVPAEAFLHLPQPQKFAPKILLEPTEILITQAAVTLDEHGGGRLVLGPRSTVAAGAPLRETPTHAAWDPAGAVRRIRDHAVSPLDLEVELQEDLVITDYELGATVDHPFRGEQQVVPIRAGGLELDAVISRGPDGVALAAALDDLRRPRAARPPLYGLVHYEMARLVFQPLTTFADDGPRHLMISRDHIDLASLMKTLDFTT